MRTSAKKAFSAILFGALLWTGQRPAASQTPAIKEATVADIGADGSYILMKPGWSISGAYYLSGSYQVVHAFGNGFPGKEPVHVEMAVMKPDKRSDQAVVEGLRNEFLNKMHVPASKVFSKTLSNKKRFFYVISLQSERGKQVRFLDGFYSYSDRRYYVSALAEASKVTAKEFGKAIPGMLAVLGTCKVPEKKPSK